MLATIESIPARVDAKLRQMQRELPEQDPSFFAGMELRPSNLSRGQLEEIERVLGRKLPDDFLQLALTYDLGGLELGGVVFGDESDFSTFLLRQITDPQATWGASVRPLDLLLLGGSDGYLILLDCSDGRVMACLRDTRVDERRVVASGFSKFFRGLATLFLEEEVPDPDTFARKLAAATGSDPGADFWLHRIRGFA
jgi:hypothetical protein